MAIREQRSPLFAVEDIRIPGVYCNEHKPLVLLPVTYPWPAPCGVDYQDPVSGGEHNSQ